MSFVIININANECTPLVKAVFLLVYSYTAVVHIV